MADARERLIVDLVLAALLLLVPAFLLHADARFAGSLAGFVLGAGSAALMILLLVYPLVKYSPVLKALVARCLSMPALLAISLVVSMMIVVVTGFVGRYYLPQTATELRQQQTRLAMLRSAYEHVAAALSSPERPTPEGSAMLTQSVPLLQLVDGISDLEAAISSRETVKKIFMQWIGLHVLAAIVMYALLAVHVAAEVYYGLRWLA